nr:class I SAM-dependent methyltransferase [Nitrospinota bacterium]
MEKIEHFYKNIEGWFTFPHLYSKAVESSIGDSHFVEVGCWKGQSSAYMAVEIINSGKKIKFDVVDTFKGSIEHIDENSPAFEPILKSEGTIRGVFEENIKPVKSNINILEMASQEASLLYEDTSLDFVFIDAAHDYESVR